MDTFNQLLQAIGTLGFPVVMCLLMVYQNNKMNASHSEEIKALTDKFSKALDDNTRSLNKLVTKIEVHLFNIDNKKGRSGNDSNNPNSV